MNYSIIDYNEEADTSAFKNHGYIPFYKAEYLVKDDTTKILYLINLIYEENPRGSYKLTIRSLKKNHDIEESESIYKTNVGDEYGTNWLCYDIDQTLVAWEICGTVIARGKEMRTRLQMLEFQLKRLDEILNHTDDLI